VFQDKVAGAVFVGNAFGKLAGSTQVNELGTIETPIVLTNTLSVGTAMDAVVTLSTSMDEVIKPCVLHLAAILCSSQAPIAPSRLPFLLWSASHETRNYTR